MDSATLRQEVSSTESDLRSSQRDLTFAVAEENNTEDKEKKGEIGNKIEKLKGDIGVNASRHSSAIQDLRGAEAAERKEKLVEETEKQKSEEIAQKKETETVKPEDKEVDNKDTKKTAAKKEPVLIGGELYDIKDGHEDPKIMQDILLAKLKEQVTPEAKDSKEDVSKDKSAVTANVSTAPAIASISSVGITQDSSSPTATSRIQGATGSSGPST